MKIIDKLLDRALGAALARRYQINEDHLMVFMDATQEITLTDQVIMRAMASALSSMKCGSSQ